MSSSSTLGRGPISVVREARSRAREQAFGQLAIPTLEFDFPIRVALSPSGHFLVGEDVPVLALRDYLVCIRVGDGTGGFLTAQGRLTTHLQSNRVARHAYSAVHGPATAFAWLRADVIAWHRNRDTAHAFYPREWSLEAAWSEDEGEEIIDHLNDRHAALLPMLAQTRVEERVRAISIDPDGLLLSCRTHLTHVAFARVAETADRALHEIYALLRGQRSVRSAAVQGAL